MEQINQYKVLRALKTFNDALQVWLVQDSAGKQYELLTIAQSQKQAALLHRVLGGMVGPLLQQQWVGLQEIKEVGHDLEQGYVYIVYAYEDAYKSLVGAKDWATFQTMLDISRGLDTLKKRNLENFVINPLFIRVNAKGNGKLCWLGLWEYFVEENLLNTIYLSSTSLLWLKRREDIEQKRPTYQDDIYALVKSFEFVVKRQAKHTAARQLLTRGLAPLSEKGFRTYGEFISLLEELPIQAQHQEDYKAICVKRNLKSISAATFRLLLKDMNQGLKLKLANKKSTRGCIEGFFSSLSWSGKFVLNHDSSFFVPYCHQEINHKVFHHPEAFTMEAYFGEYASRQNWLPFFEEKLSIQQAQTRRYQKRRKLVQAWKQLAQQEQGEIERKAIRIPYQKRTYSKTGQLDLLLGQDSTLDWNALVSFEKKAVRWLIKGQSVGRLLHCQAFLGRISMDGNNISLEEIPEKGELVQDIYPQISQYKKQVAACEAFLEANILNPSLTSILTSPSQVDLRAKQHTPNLLEEQFKNLVYNQQLAEDQAQLEAVWGALNHQPIFLIQGPPGTGKTTVIVELIQQIVQREKSAKILVVSQSNKAVDNVLERLYTIYQKAQEPLAFMRLASRYSLDKDRVSSAMIAHTFERKLEDWVQATKRATQDVLEKKQKQGETQLQTIQQDWLAFLEGLISSSENERAFLNNGSSKIDFLTAMLQDISLVGSTCLHIASAQYQAANFQFDYVIMDESSKAAPAEALVPINMGRKIIMIGDHQQLPPVVTCSQKTKEKPVEDNGLTGKKALGTSLFELLIEAFEDDPKKQHYVKMLTTQYRMPPQIGSLISNHFYKGKLTNAPLNMPPEKRHPLPFKKASHLVFMSTAQQENPYDNGDPLNRSNLANVRVIQDILAHLNGFYKDNLGKPRPIKIAIIASYRGQVSLMKKELNLDLYTNFKALIEIDTVDKFQGAERDIIIYDIVRSRPNVGDSIGFLADHRRINVAFSRAQHLLFIVGDHEYVLNRATLPATTDFPVFKLKQIVEDLDKEGLIYHNLQDL